MNESITSIGHLASQLSVPVSYLLNVTRQLEIEPRFTINSVDHFSASDCNRIANHVRAKLTNFDHFADRSKNIH